MENPKELDLLIVPSIRTAIEQYYCCVADRINRDVLPSLKILHLDSEDILTQLLDSITSCTKMDNFISIVFARFIESIDSSDYRDISAAINMFQEVTTMYPITRILYPRIDRKFLKVINNIIVINRKEITEASKIKISGELAENMIKGNEAINEVNRIIGGNLTNNKVDFLFSKISGGKVRTPNPDKLFEFANRL